MNALLEILLSKKVVVPEKYEQYKDIFKYFRGKQVTVENSNVKGKDLSNIFDDSEKFYLKSAKNGFLMGDILENLSPIWLGGKEDGSISIKKSADAKFMILSTECDCEIRDDGKHFSYVRVCPVYEDEKILSGMQGDQKQLLGSLKANTIIEYFWMPKIKKKSNGLFADLTHIFSIDIHTLYDSVSRGDVTKVCSLSEVAFFLLQIKLAWFFSRPEPDDNERVNLDEFKLL